MSSDFDNGSDARRGRRPNADVTRILKQLAQGDTSVKDELWQGVHDELHEKAKYVLYGKQASLRPTELMSELFLKFEQQRKVPLNWLHFRAIASRLMYRILGDHIRQRGRRKRAFVTLETEELGRAGQVESRIDLDLLALRQAMGRLEKDDPLGAEIAIYKFFGELTMAEIGELVELTERQVYRRWRYARSKLLTELQPEKGEA